MKRVWTLAELAEAFPGSVDEDPERTLRCVKESTGSGRFVKQTGGRENYADVKVRAQPGSTFQLRFLHRWPDELGVDQVKELDRALLDGVLAGSARVDAPPWGCSLDCTAVDYLEGRTTPKAVSIAAALAIQSVVEVGHWVIDGPPAQEPA